ncbi:MAG: YbeD family protein [Gammaproteobacteria bacterium]
MSESDSLLRFPCDFPIKVVGHGEADFELEVIARIRCHAPDLSEGAVRSRPSQGGKYLAVTVTVRATSQAQLDAIYRALTDWERALMVL